MVLDALVLIFAGDAIDRININRAIKRTRTFNCNNSYYSYTTRQGTLLHPLEGQRTKRRKV